MTDRPDVVVFDLLETLINLDPLAARLEEVGRPAALLQPWFLRFQRDAMALTLAGDEAPFEPVAREALRTETHYELSEADIDHVIAGRAGALAGWCARLEQKPGDVFLPADVTGENLVEVADKLLTLH